ncbi:ATP-binding protein, partial [Candidatus Micrarchaeota archaeon]|nr:ATP-binding protein [Candidatus Micrarchaeota archaeon]
MDRIAELDALNEEFAGLEKRSSLAVVYGRRRVGKTELIKEFTKAKNHVYFLATLQSKEEVVKNFSLKAAEFFQDKAAQAQPHVTWNGFFEYLAKEIKARKKPIILAFDEFTYLIQQDRATPSVFQYHWDETLKNLPVMLILCGSYVGMMEKEVLSYKSPLYGRTNRRLQVTQLDFKHVREFAPQYSKKQLVELYAILGAVPFYLRQFDSSKTPLENVEQAFLDKTKSLYNDGLLMLREELKEPRNYLSILKAISFGKTTQKEIADNAHLEPLLVGKYLDVLKGMKIVSRLVPATEKNPEKSKKGLYRITDNYYDFWLKFVYPYAEYVEEGRCSELMKNIISPSFNAYVGRSFEALAKKKLVELNQQGKLPFSFERIGGFWHGDCEIDLVALNEKTKEILFAEVKWSDLDE